MVSRKGKFQGTLSTLTKKRGLEHRRGDRIAIFLKTSMEICNL